MPEELSSRADFDKVEVFSKTMRMNKKYGKVAVIEIKKRDPFIPPSIEKKIRDTVVKSRAVTPNELAVRFDIRVSAVKKLLKAMEDEGLVTLISGGSKLKIYRGKNAK